MTLKHGWLLGILASALTLVGCGGGGSSSFADVPSSSSSGVTNGAASITLISSVPQIPSNNSTPAKLTAIVTDKNNAVVTGATVAFSTDAKSNGIITPIATSGANSSPGVTDANGQAQANLTIPGDPSNRTITVTATVGTVSKTLQIGVVGTQMSVTGPASLILNAAGTFSASLTDSGGNGIANQTVTVTSAKGNTLSAGTLTTDATGHVKFTVTAAASGTDTITVSSLGSSASSSLTVSSQNFTFSSPKANTSVAIGAILPITLVWTNNGAPVANQTISFSTTRGTFTGGVTTINATTDATGTATVSISSTTAGPAVITASATGGTSSLTLLFVATQPSTIDVQASPATVPTSGSSTITAIVRDANNNLVANQIVDFQLTDKTGGSLSVGSATTNAQGVASTVYTATTTSSAANGVTITATVQNTAISKSVNLTVGGQTLFLSLGTGNTINVPNATQFSMPFTAQALDAGGNPVTGVTITFTVHSFPYAEIPPGQAAVDGSVASQWAAYQKGAWTTTPNAACNGVIGTAFCQIVTYECWNEDVAGSGLLNQGQDVNGNGRLDPGDVASASPGSGVTDSTGTVALSVLYPQDHAEWVRVKLTASATVSGTQTTTSSVFWLPILANDVNTSTNGSPPGAISPYGTAACNVAH